MDGRMGRTQSSSTIQIIPVSWEKERAAVARNSENSWVEWGNLSESWKVQRRLKRDERVILGGRHLWMELSGHVKNFRLKNIFVLISEHALLPVRKPSQLTVGQLPLLLPPLLLCQIRTPCQGLWPVLTGLKNSINSSAIQPRHHQPPHLGLQATPPPPLLSFLLLSGIFLNLVCAHPAVFLQTWEKPFYWG